MAEYEAMCGVRVCVCVGGGGGGGVDRVGQETTEGKGNCSL